MGGRAGRTGSGLGDQGCVFHVADGAGRDGAGGCVWPGIVDGRAVSGRCFADDWTGCCRRLAGWAAGAFQAAKYLGEGAPVPGNAWRAGLWPDRYLDWLGAAIGGGKLVGGELDSIDEEEIDVLRLLKRGKSLGN